MNCRMKQKLSKEVGSVTKKRIKNEEQICLSSTYPVSLEVIVDMSQSDIHKRYHLVPRHQRAKEGKSEPNWTN